MRYFLIEPEIAGGLGKSTLMDRTNHPPVVSRLHYELEGWLGDALLESFPAFVITEQATSALVQAGITGADFGTVDVTTSDQFEEMYPDRKIPNFFWLRIKGKAAQDDFGTAPDGRLVVSQRTLDILSQFGISNAIVEPFIS